MSRITIRAGKFLRLLDYLERIGLDSGAMATSIGLSPNALQALSPEEQLPAQQYSRLYKAAVNGMQSLGRPLPWAAGLGSEAFELMCHCMISGRTLGDALRLASRFDELLYPVIGYRVSLEEEGGSKLVKLGYQVDASIDQSELVPSQWDRADSGATVSRSSGLLVWHSLCGWLTGQSIEAREMRIAGPFVSQEYYDGLAGVFHCPIYFDADENCFSFQRDALSRRLVHTVDSLTEFLDNAVYQLIEMEREPASTSAAIKSIVTIELPGSMPSFSEIAQTLHMSESSLRRRLQRENTSYQALKDEVRCEVAISKLINEDTKVADLADYLGFTEPSSFVRSFKGWTGQTPSSYRDSIASLAGA